MIFLEKVANTLRKKFSREEIPQIKTTGGSQKFIPQISIFSLKNLHILPKTFRKVEFRKICDFKAESRK